jgi:exopolyphosphatase / guanosine-5'-triphosphate,3'-diphosphate pyrophosphatase
MLMLCGIIDIGSNTIRLNVYSIENTKFEVLFSKKENAGIVSYVKKKQMTQEGIDKLERCLSRFKKMLDSLHITTYSAFATASLRNITNPQEVIDQIKKNIGIEIELLSGADEGRISFEGAIHGLDCKEGIYIDTGGASTEIIRYEETDIDYVSSMPIGSLNLYNKYVSRIIPNKKEIQSIQERVLEELKALNISRKLLTFDHLSVTGGSMRAIKSVLVAQKKISNDTNTIDAKLLNEAVEEFSKDTTNTMHLFLKVKPDRVHTLFCGLLIIATIADYTNAKTIQISCNGVREGYLIKKYLGKDNTNENNAK